VLKKNIGESSDQGIKGSIEGKSISRQATYDVNSLDRKADISMYYQDEDNDKANMWTAVVLGIVGFFTLVLIIVLCWRRQRNRRLKATRNRTLTENSNVIDPKLVPISVREARENRLNEERVKELTIESGIYAGSDREDVKSQRAASTNQWVQDSNRQEHM